MKLTDKQFRLLNVILIIGSIVFLPLSIDYNWFIGFICLSFIFIFIFIISMILALCWSYIQKGEGEDPFETLYEFTNNIYKKYKKFLKE